MARPRTGTASKSAVKRTAEPLDFSTWTAEAERILEQKPQAVRWQDWRDAFIRHLSPEEAADRAAVAARIARPTADRLGRHGRRR